LPERRPDGTGGFNPLPLGNLEAVGREDLGSFGNTATKLNELRKKGNSKSK